MIDAFRTCIAACQACSAACEHCFASCLAEDDLKPLVHCMALDVDCAEACRLAAAFMTRRSTYAPAACRVCATICDACASECSRHSMDHCQDCAAACRRCAEECRRMAA